ncbi:hypothetical protein HBH70_006790 [Parastagonospora nodorum]|nr:hypothetical protein HBH70_006790 [Parastagonospora nodorum]
MMDTRQVRSRTISNLSGAAVLIICFCFYVLEMLKVGPLSSWLCSLIGRFLTDGPPSGRVRDLVLQYPQPHRRLLLGAMHSIVDASEKELQSSPERRLQAGHAASSATIRSDLISRCRWRKRRYCESVAAHKVPRAMFSHAKTLIARGPCSTSSGIYEDAEMGIGRLGSVMREWSLGYGKRFREVMERAMTWRCRGRAEKCSVDAADDWAGIRGGAFIRGWGGGAIATGVGSCADLKLQSGVGVWVCDDDTQLWRVHFSEL